MQLIRAAKFNAEMRFLAFRIEPESRERIFGSAVFRPPNRKTRII